MKYITNESNNPKYNLAFEEYCFKNLPLDDKYVILWINSPAIIVGKNQNTIEELNTSYIEEEKIDVVRRITGGGAVYHDLGNLNFSIITKLDGEKVIDFKKYNIPIVKALEKIGVGADLSGRNDISIEGKKFSGIAQSIYKDRVLNHGTLLFDTKLDRLEGALKVKRDKYESKGIKSVRSRVTNIKPYLKEDIGIDGFKEILLRTIFQVEGKEAEEYLLGQDQLREIKDLYEKKYSSWEWNYGKSPKFTFKNYKRYDFGSLDVRVQVKAGKIEAIKIYGDFFGAEDIGEVEEVLRGTNYEREDIKNKLREISLANYMGNIGIDEFVELITNAS